ncbi:MAG: hypothetical protein ABIP03_11645 [Aquihabitans sp.]
MLPTTEREGFERELSEVADAKRARQRLLVQRSEAVAEVEAAVAEVENRRSALVSEVQDVQHLESVSITRLLSSISGNRDEDLRREIAEREAARLALSVADARQVDAVRHLASVEDRLVAVGDVDARWEQALDHRERWMAVADEDNASRLAEIAEERGKVDAELRECDEALAAGHLASGQLAEVAKSLGSAKEWSDMDTWFGGGVFTSSIKHDRLDTATSQLRQADVALSHLRHELADLAHAGVDTLTISTWDRAFDVFCDNLFSDFAIHRRVKSAIAQVDKLRSTVAKITNEVSARSAELAATSLDLQTERRRLLDGTAT